MKSKRFTLKINSNQRISRLITSQRRYIRKHFGRRATFDAQYGWCQGRYTFGTKFNAEGVRVYIGSWMTSSRKTKRVRFVHNATILCF